MTFEAIMERMLGRIDNDYDKREGSVAYTLLAPAALEMAQMYAAYDGWLKLAFAHTSEGEYLDLRCLEEGLKRRAASQAIRKGIFDTKVTIGTRFGIEDIIYKVVEHIAGFEYKLKAETPGTVGNQFFGNLMPIDYVNGLGKAVLSEVLIPGEDTETDQQLLERFNEKVQRPVTSGNVNHYSQWANEVAGVGAARPVPLWKGNNTVKLLIVDAEMAIPTSALITEVQKYIDPSAAGLGLGKAPIGAFCTVAAAQAQAINITADITGIAATKVADDFNKAVTAYLKHQVAEGWQTGKGYVISYAKVGAILLEALTKKGGTDYQNLRINGTTGNIALTDKVAVKGTVTLNDAT